MKIEGGRLILGRRTRVVAKVKTVDWYLREGDRVEISELKDATGFSFENRRWTIGILIEESGRVVLLELKDASGFIGVEGRGWFYWS